MPKRVIKRPEEAQNWFEGSNWHRRFLEESGDLQDWSDRLSWWLDKEVLRAYHWLKNKQDQGDYQDEIRKPSVKAVGRLHLADPRTAPYATSNTTLGKWLNKEIQQLPPKAIALIAKVEFWTDGQARSFLEDGVPPEDGSVEVLFELPSDRAKNLPAEELPQLITEIGEALIVAAHRLQMQTFSMNNGNSAPTLPTLSDSVPFVAKNTKDEGQSMCTSGAYLSFLLSERGFNPRSDIAIREFVSRSMANQIPANRMSLLVSDQAKPSKNDWSAIAQTLNVIDGIEEDGDQEPWDRKRVLEDFEEYKVRTQNNAIK